MTAETEKSSLLQLLAKEAVDAGYFLNPDTEFATEIVAGLEANRARYGYRACPCRLASGNQENDLDIICPCDYRDADVQDYGACFCALYVSKEAVEGKTPIKSIPDRRASKKEKSQYQHSIFKSSIPVWRCKVCGYLCAREHPPAICPICKATKERFEEFG